MLTKLENPNTNIIVIIIAEIITCSITFTLNYDKVNWGSIVIKWIPAIIALITLFCYFISRLFFKKHNWVISLLGIIIMSIATVKIYDSF